MATQGGLDSDAETSPYSAPFDERARRSYESGLLFCDIIFIVGDGEATRRIPGHRYIVSLASEVFLKAFTGEFADGRSPEYRLEGIHPDTFEQFLRYAYGGGHELSATNVFSVMEVAERFLVEPLKEECVRFVESSVTAHNALELLKSACDTRLTSNIVSVLNMAVCRLPSDQQSQISEILQQLSFHGFHEVMDSTELMLSEEGVWEMILAWTNFHGQTDIVPNGTIGEIDDRKGMDEDLKQEELMGLVECVRFRDMDPVYFSRHVQPTEIIGALDGLRILSYLTLKDRVETDVLVASFNHPLLTKEERAGARGRSDLDLRFLTYPSSPYRLLSSRTNEHMTLTNGTLVLENDEYAIISNTTDNFPPQNTSFTLWVRFEWAADAHIHDWCPIISKIQDAHTREWGLWFHPNGHFLFQTYTPVHANIQHNSPFIRGMQTAAMVYDDDAHVVRLFQNGVEVHHAGIGVETFGLSNLRNIAIGGTGFHQRFHGTVYEFQFFKEKLTADDITALQNGRRV